MRFLNFLIRPASSLCNLRCRYCSYEDIAEDRTQKSMGIMTAETVEFLLTEAYSLVDESGTVSFAFQGGEPTVAGLDPIEQKRGTLPFSLTPAVYGKFLCRVLTCGMRTGNGNNILPCGFLTTMSTYR